MPKRSARPGRLRCSFRIGGREELLSRSWDQRGHALRLERGATSWRRPPWSTCYLARCLILPEWPAVFDDGRLSGADTRDWLSAVTRSRDPRRRTALCGFL